MKSFTINYAEQEDDPQLVVITNFEIVIDNPNPYEGEIVYHDLDFKGGGGVFGTAVVGWSTTLINASGLTTLKFTGEPGGEGEPDWVCDFSEDDLPFEVTGFIRIDFEGVKSFDVTLEGTSDS